MNLLKVIPYFFARPWNELAHFFFVFCCLCTAPSSSLSVYVRAFGLPRLIMKQAHKFFPKQGVGALARTLSAQVASSSHALLRALEGGNIDEVRSVLVNTDRGLKRYIHMLHKMSPLLFYEANYITAVSCTGHTHTRTP